MKKNKPKECQKVDLIDKKAKMLLEYHDKWTNKSQSQKDIVLSQLKRKYELEIQKEDQKRVVLERKTSVAEIVLSMAVLWFLTGSIFLYLKYKKHDQMEERM